LYISLCAHGGRPEVLTDWFDPSIVDETDPTSIDPALNMYDKVNGPPYSPEFVIKYRAAQVERNHRITAWCHEELARLSALGMSDRAFHMYRTWADLRLMDPTIDPSDRKPQWCYAGDPKSANFSPRGIGLTNTLRTWLSMWSLKESHCQGPPHLNRIDNPALVIQSLADTGVFPSDAQGIFDALGGDVIETKVFFDVAVAALFDAVFIVVLSSYTHWLYRFCSRKVGLFFTHSSRWYLVQVLISIYLTINAWLRA
ncbi:hypothetical protein N8881_02395, partial [Pseudomonadales bacterium]|nr:hypothetical protein [Pseudomonadales bacterium]